MIKHFISEKPDKATWEDLEGIGEEARNRERSDREINREFQG